MINPAEIKKILVLDFSRIGDTLMHEPALRAIKLHFSNAQIDAITDKANFDLLAEHPAIRHATIFPRKIRNLQSLFAYIRAILKIRREKYDLLINFYMGRATPLIARLSDIPLRLAFDRYARLRNSHNLLAKAPSSYSNWIVESNEIVRPLGINPDTIWPQVKFFVSDAALYQAQSFIPKHAITPYIALQLATSDPVKCWPPAKYAELAEKLYRERGFIPVVISSPDQIARVDEFFKIYPTDLPSIRLPVISLMQLAGTLSLVNLLISGDTGIMHLGFAVEVPTVGIFTYGRPEYATSATTRKMIVFREDENLPKYPSGQLHGTKDLSVTEVYQAVESLLEITANKRSIKLWHILT